jgi:hypothetical protein
MISKLKTFLAKSKWHLIAGAAILTFLVLYFWKDTSGLQKILRGAIKAQQEVVSKELERKRERVKGNEDELRKIDVSLEEIDKKIKQLDTVDTLGLKELSDAWKTVSL